MELARTTQLDLDISVEGELLNYTYSGTDPREVIARVDLGDLTKPIAGGGSYLLKIYIDGVTVSPSSLIDVDAGVTRTVVASRSVPLEPGDVVIVTVTGLPADTAVNCITTLRDATPARAEEITGTGSVEVDHNHGGAETMTYRTEAGAGIDGASIQIYLTSDYDDGNRGNAFVVARSTTGPDGRWVRSVMLNPGSYTAVFYKQGSYGPDREEFTVA